MSTHPTSYGPAATASPATHGALPAPLHDALARLRAVRPGDADDAASALAEALAPVAGSAWPEVAWRSSALTGTGMPVELAWTSRDVAVRWTCEASGPETPEVERLARCQAAARIDMEAWAAQQSGHRLRWGGWLGGRHLDGARRAKVYAELPAGSAVGSPWALAGRALHASVPGLAWRMAGCNDDGTVELYARVPLLTMAALRSAARIVGDTDHLVDLVAELLGRGPARPEPPRPSGLSLVMSSDGDPVALTWFAFAKSMWSSDALTARTLTGLCRAGSVATAPGSLAVYGALVAGRDDGRWRHGMVGAGVDRAGATWLQAGVRPT